MVGEGRIGRGDCSSLFLSVGPWHPRHSGLNGRVLGADVEEGSRAVEAFASGMQRLQVRSCEVAEPQKSEDNAWKIWRRTLGREDRFVEGGLPFLAVLGRSCFLNTATVSS